jgi:DNA-binding NarL/FixJ family response regulator
MTISTIRILIADPHVLFAEGLSAFLNNPAGNIAVLGIAAGGEETIAMMERCRPDVILMDISMPGADGIETVRRIKAKNADTKVIILSARHDESLVRAALLAGASGYFSKDISPAKLAGALRAADNGIIQLSSGIAESLMRKHGEEKRKPLLKTPAVENKHGGGGGGGYKKNRPAPGINPTGTGYMYPRCGRL